MQQQCRQQPSPQHSRLECQRIMLCADIQCIRRAQTEFNSLQAVILLLHQVNTRCLVSSSTHSQCHWPPCHLNYSEGLAMTQAGATVTAVQEPIMAITLSRVANQPCPPPPSPPPTSPTLQRQVAASMSAQPRHHILCNTDRPRPCKPGCCQQLLTTACMAHKAVCLSLVVIQSLDGTWGVSSELQPAL
jgi:hypothetical protein